MSRRIATLAAAATGLFVLATPTFADRECFGAPCQLPELAEPPAEVADQPTGTVTPPTAPTALPRVIEPHAAATPRPVEAPIVTQAPTASPTVMPVRPATVASPKPAPVIAAPAQPQPRFAIEDDDQLTRPVRRP